MSTFIFVYVFTSNRNKCHNLFSYHFNKKLKWITIIKIKRDICKIYIVRYHTQYFKLNKKFIKLGRCWIATVEVVKMKNIVKKKKLYKPDTQEYKDPVKAKYFTVFFLQNSNLTWTPSRVSSFKKQYQFTKKHYPYNYQIFLHKLSYWLHCTWPLNVDICVNR